MKLEKIGLQLYTIRDYMNSAEQIRTSFRKLKELGYDVVQTAGCAIPYAEFGQIAKEEGLEICGTHDDFDLMVKDTEKALENHRYLGTTNMGVGGFWPDSIKEIEDFINNANTVAGKIREQGFKFTYHNHDQEFIRYENGKRMMDMLIDGLDARNTTFVLDTYWVQYGGGDIYEWIRKLAGRIDILHLKDMAAGRQEPYITEVGNGNLNWERILETAKEVGVKYYIVEQDQWPGDPFDSVARSSEYLHKHFM
ncbi:MAG: sugar phosphate isomerase/epimerase [Clostridia bacterium]|nr:sugar phosphate isomerase/epimerase [Clostridia bacterium]